MSRVCGIPTILDVSGPAPYAPAHSEVVLPLPPDSAPPLPVPGADTTPAMRQYLDAKRLYPLALVFFRMGDFYELFYEDALVAARALDLTLTSRSKDAATGAAVPMCGVPFHAGEGYIGRLVKLGHRVAICEQVEDPKKAKGVVKREVVRVVTPGTLADASLDARDSAFLMAVTGLDAPPGAQARLGVALLDLSTGEFQAAEYAGAQAFQALDDEIAVLAPREIVVAAGIDPHALLPSSARIAVTPVDGWSFDPARAAATLCEQLRVAGLQGFGLDGRPQAVAAAGALVRYLRDTQKADLAHVRAIRLRETAGRLIIDPMTMRHLEVVESSQGGRAGSLLDELDRTVTPMGGRMLRAWLLSPLVALEPIRERLDAVEELAFRTADRGKVRDTLKAVLDLERLVSKVALATSSPRDLVALARSLAAVPRARLLLGECQAPLITRLVAALDDLTEVRQAIDAALADEPPLLARDGGAIRDGVDAELDELRRISRSGKQIIAELEAAERTRTGIQSLKVRFNRVFGYYIEISRANLHAVPDDYIRKQTIAGGERFVTPALKGHEEKVLGADERSIERELELVEAVRARVSAESARVLDTARAVAALDVLAGLAEVAAIGNYTKPYVHDGDELVATDVRHPVVERLAGGTFVPNDVELNGSAQQLVVLTGPNMGGKSTYLRQVALLSLMAQAGSFVPAREAKLGLVDRIYARVGASDNIARGQSTFMVEMQETAHILNGATSKSLVVLDEVGRGTATFDGLSIAWAVAEHLATNQRARPKTLFATHYHELTDLADGVAGVVNAHVAVQEWKDDIVFLHKILPGRSDRSYGIHVARLAGLPVSVLARAREILFALERDELARGGKPAISGTPVVAQQQLGLFQAPMLDDGLRDRLRAVDIDQTTPLEALRLLAAFKREAEE